MIPNSFSIESLAWTLRRIVAPPCCEACQAQLFQNCFLCKSCETELRLLPVNRCDICALPFQSDSASAQRCGGCLLRSPSFEKASACFEFEGSAGKLLRAAKFQNQPRLMEYLARRTLLLFEERMDEFRPDFLLPMPLHWWRRLRRGFNQSYLLALHLRRLAKVSTPFLQGIRRRYSPPQSDRGREERLKALRDGFQCKAKLTEGGCKILVIDDVLTTGATAEALSAALKKAGASAVEVLVVARVRRTGRK